MTTKYHDDIRGILEDAGKLHAMVNEANDLDSTSDEQKEHLEMLEELDKAYHALETTDCSSWDEHAAIIKECGDTVESLIRAIEHLAPEWHSRSDLILRANELLKWIDDEISPENLKEFFGYPPTKE